MQTPNVFPSMDPGPYDEGTRLAAKPREAPWTTVDSRGHPEPPAFVLALAIPTRGEGDLFRLLRTLKATPSQEDVVVYLANACRRLKQRGTFESLRTMAKKSGIPPTTFRQAIVWLNEVGLVARCDHQRGRRKVTMTWCLWLFGAKDASGDGTLSAAQSARFSDADGARFSADKRDRKWIKTSNQTTTGRAVAESSSSSGTEGGEPAQASPTGKSAPPASLEASESRPEPTEIDLAIASTLAMEVPCPVERSRIEAEVPGWLERCPDGKGVEWIVWLILEATVARAERQDRDPVHDLVGFARGTLDRWIAAGFPTLRRARVKLPPSGKTPELAEAEARREADERQARLDAEREQAAQLEAEKRAVKAKWECLPESERTEIIRRVKADNPGLGRWKNMLEPLCFAAMGRSSREGPPD